jgi:MFS family permease
MKKRTIYILLAGNMIGGINYGVMFTMLDNFRDKYHITESALGVIVAIGFFTSFLMQILVAPHADRGHAKRIVVVGAIMQGLGAIAMAMGHVFWVLAIGRFAMGIGTGLAYPAVRRIIISGDPNNVGHNLGLMLSTDVGGFALGPVVSAILLPMFGIPAPFIAVAIATGVVLVLILMQHVDEVSAEDAPTEKLAFDLLRIKPLLGAVLIGLALFLMIGTFDSLWSVMMDDLHASQWIANLGITLFALPLIVLGPRGGRFAETIGPFKASIGGLAIGAFFITSYGFVPWPIVMLIIGTIHGVVDGLTVTGGSMAIALVSPSNRIASAQGLYGGLQVLTAGVAATFAGWEYQHLGRFATFMITGATMLCLVGSGSFLARESLHLTGNGEGPVAA